MTVGSSNPFPSILITEGTEPAAPAAGKQRLYIDSTTHHLMRVPSSGTEVDIEGGGSSDLDAIITASSGQDIADALSGAAAPDAGNVFATMADVGGGGGLAQSFVGYNTVGGSWQQPTTRRCYFTPVTLASAGILLSIDVYLRPRVDNLDGFLAMVLADNAGAPGVLRAGGGAVPNGIYFPNSSSMPGAGRWHSTPIGAYLTAGTYWIGFENYNEYIEVAYDATGADQYFTAANFVVTGAYPSSWAITTTANQYSIRGNFLS